MPMAYSSRKPSLSVIYYTLFSSPLGRIGIAATPRGLCRLSLNVAGESAFRRRLETEYRRSAIRRDEHFTEIAAGLRAYFSGRPVQFNATFDLQEGTAFQRKVWRSLRRIPYGQMGSYRSVARKIGHPKSFRAVGGACGNNPVAVLIPCHRVIGADGKLGGFTGGLRLKRQLLALEHPKRLLNK